MKKENKGTQPALGGCSLLVIFAVLCLTVFALLSLHTVLAQQRLSQASAQRVRDWYAADLQAQEVFARLRSGEIPADVEQIGEEYRYSVPVSQNQTLEVTVKETKGSWEVCSWQTVAHPVDGDTALPVWQRINEPEGEKQP